MRRAGQPSCSQLVRRSRYILQVRAHQQLFVCCLLTQGRVSSTSRVVSTVENAALPDGSVWIKRLSCRVQLAVAVNASKRLATTCRVASGLTAAANSGEVGQEGELLASVDAWCAAATAAATAAASSDPEPDDDASSAVEGAQLAEQHIKLVQQLLQLKGDHSPQPQKARSKAAAPPPGLLTAACRLHAHLHCVLMWLPDSAACSLPLLFSCAAEFQLPLPSLAQQQVEWLLEHPLWLEALSRPCQDWPQGHGLVPGPGRAPPLLLPLLAALGAAVAVPGAAAPSLPPALEAHIASWPSFSPGQRQDLQQAVWRVEAAAEEAKLEYSGGEGEGRRKEGGKGQGKGSMGATVGTPAKVAAPGPAAGAGNGSRGQQGAAITSAAQASAALSAIALQQATAEIAVGLRRSASSALQQEGLPGSAVLANTLAVAGSGGETAGVTSQAGSAPNLQPHPPAAAQGGKGARVKGKGATQQGGGGQVEEGGASQGKGKSGHGLRGSAGGGESQPHGQGQHGKGEEVARWQDLASATAALNLDLKTASSNQLQPMVVGWCQALLAAERNGHLKGSSSSSSSSSSGGSSQREAKSGQGQAHLEQQALQAIWVKVYQSFLSRLRQLMAGCPSESLEHAQLLSMLQAVQHQLHRVLLCLQPAQTELLVAALQSYINSGKAAVKPLTPATKATLAHLLAQPAWLDLLCKRETAKSTPIVRIMRVLSLLAVWTNDCPCSASPELMLRVNKDLEKREMQYVQLAVYCMERGIVTQLISSGPGAQAGMPSASELQNVLFNCDVDKAESMLTKLQRLQPVPETSTNDAPGSTAEVVALPATPTTVSKATPGPLRDLYASLAKVKNSPGIPSPTVVVHQVHTAVAEIARSSAGLRTGVAHATSPGRAPGKQAHGDTPASGAEAELLSLLAQLLPAVSFGCTASQVLQLLTRLNSLDGFSLRLPKFEPLLTALACRVEGWLDTAQQEHVVPRLIRQLAAGQVPASWSGLLPLAVHTAQHLHAWTPPHCHQALLCLLKPARATKSTSLHQPLQQALLAAGPVLAQAGSPRPQQQGVVGGSGGGGLRPPVTTTTRNIWGGQAAAVLKPNAVQEDTVAMYAELLEHSPEELVPSVFASIEQAMRQFRHCSNETAVRLAQLVLEQVEGEDMSRDEQGVLQVEPGLVRSLGPLLKNLNTRIEAYGQWGASAAMPVRMLNQLARMSLLLQKEDQVTVRATMKHVGNELQAEWHLEQLDAATLFELTYAVTTVGADDREVYNKLMQASSRRLDGLSATELVACLARQARPIPMSPQATQLFNVTMREAIAKLHKMTAHDLATLIHAISQLHLVRDLPMYTPKLPELCNALATHPSWLAEPDPEDMYLVLASLSLLRWHHKPLLEQAATAVLKNKEARNARIINKALMCAALLMHSSSTTPKLFSACAQRFASLMRRGELNGRVLVRLAWATAVANQNPDCQVPAGQGKAATKTIVRPFVQLLLEALKDKSQSIAASKPLYGSLAFSLRIWAVTLPSLKVPQELVDLRKKESHSSTVSDTQKVVTRILGSTPSLGLHKVQSEVNVGHGWFVDITATGPAGVKYAFEVDGPQHFAANDSTVQLGNTAIRDHCVGKLGYLVVNVTADMLAGQGIMQTNKSMADKQTLGAIKNAMAFAAEKQQKCTAEATYAVA